MSNDEETMTWQTAEEYQAETLQAVRETIAELEMIRIKGVALSIAAEKSSIPGDVANGVASFWSWVASMKARLITVEALMTDGTLDGFDVNRESVVAIANHVDREWEQVKHFTVEALLAIN